jgi:beta-glucosidase
VNPTAATEPTATGPSANGSAGPAVDATSAAEVVASLSLEDKVRLLSGRGFWALEPVPEQGIASIVVADGPHGLRCQAAASDHLGIAAAAPATCFPTAATLGSTWDTELVEAVGDAIGAEARSLGVSVVLGPGLNLKRHPAGGRSFEYLSEDPLLSGRLAAAMVRGIQGRGVGTSVKHFAVNNQESHRLVVDAVVDERTLRELYLTGFELVVRESTPWTVMCSYNLVNGTYASEHRELLTTILRDEWGFDGLVMTDWGAANDRAAGIAAGLDLEMPSSQGAFDAEVLAAVRSGSLDESAVDRCAMRVVDLLRRGASAASGVGADPADEREQHDRHHRLARRAAAAGSVLLVNNGVLPLEPSGRIAVVGAFATEPRYQGAGSSQVTPTRVDAMLDELRDRVGDGATVTYAAGYDPRTGATTPELLDEAIAAALDADVVVCMAGLPGVSESEGFDRVSLDLPDGHVRLIEALATTPTPLVVVLSNGGVVHLPWADRVDAVLECWLGGQAGGGAVVDLLVGDAAPGGRLAESVPAHVGQLPADRNFPGSPRQVEYREGLYVGYRFHDSAGIPARFPFGSGLSYTTFDWSEIAVSGEGTDLMVQVRVTNTGARAGADVVQVYVRDVESSVHRPDKELKGFAKVHLEPGAADTVGIPLDRRSFAVWDVAAHDWLVEAGRFEVVVARSSTDPVEVVTVDVASDDELGAAARPSSFVATDDEFAAMLGHAIPTAAPVRPFGRNSTLEDLEATRIGRVLSTIVVREGLKRSAAEFPDPDDATLAMVRAMLREGPARMLVMMGDGILSFPQLDALLEALNGRWGRLARTAVGRLRRPPRS